MTLSLSRPSFVGSYFAGHVVEKEGKFAMNDNYTSLKKKISAKFKLQGNRYKSP